MIRPLADVILWLAKRIWAVMGYDFRILYTIWYARFDALRRDREGCQWRFAGVEC